MLLSIVILFSFLFGVFGLAAYLNQPVVLLALAFIPTLLRDLPFGLMAAQIQMDDRHSSDDDLIEDSPQPMGFTQDVTNKARTR